MISQNSCLRVKFQGIWPTNTVLLSTTEMVEGFVQYNECIAAGNGKILEISDTSEYIKEWYKGPVYLR